MITTRMFRLFVSSTFSDFIAEREALQKKVFPELEKYCAGRGARFQAVDLRWGITEEAQREHDTMRVCSGAARIKNIFLATLAGIIFHGNAASQQVKPRCVGSASTWTDCLGEYTHKEHDEWFGYHFRGEFKLGKRNGYGVAHFPNGDTYTGYWANDAFDGAGTYRYGNTGKLLSGIWAKGELKTNSRRVEKTSDEKLNPSMVLAWTIKGFRVYINEQLNHHVEQRDRIHQVISHQIGNINGALPLATLEILRGIPIMVSFNDRSNPKKNNLNFRPYYNPCEINPRELDKKCGSIVIPVSKMFLDLSVPYPWYLLHEYAHGYNFKVVRKRQKEINKCFDRAKKRGLYKSVKTIYGTTADAYAGVDSYEYFAELTVSYWGKNFYFPFNAKDLESYDVCGYQLMRSVWVGA